MLKITDTHYAATWLLHENAPKIDIPAELRNRINLMLKEAKPPKEMEA
jgi:oligopeptide transport system ATP-binding protein